MYHGIGNTFSQRTARWMYMKLNLIGMQYSWFPRVVNVFCKIHIEVDSGWNLNMSQMSPSFDKL